MTLPKAPAIQGTRRRWELLSLAVACVAVVSIYGVIACTTDSELGNRTAGEAYYNRLADGLAKGGLSLDLAAPQGLLALPDPYDRDASRPFRGSMYTPGRLHDLSFYRGRLYLYFSVVPALLLFLPYNAVTGMYLSHQEACLAFASLGFVASALLGDAIRRRCFPGASLSGAFLSTLCLGLVPMLPILLQRPDVWEVPVAASYAFWMVSLWILWGWLCRPSPSWVRAGSLSVTVGLAIGCRPDTILAAAILLLPAWAMVRGTRTGGRSASGLASLAALVLPLAAIGAGLAAYNDARFGDPFEFGQKYQLNGDVVRHEGYFRLRFFWYNFRLYFLEYPGWQAHFPFVRFLEVPSAPAGSGGAINPVGVLTLLPFTLFALAAPSAQRNTEAGSAEPLARLLGALSILFLSTAVPLCFFFGAVDRYEVEFLPALVLLAVVGLFGIEARLASRPAFPGLRILAYLCAAASIAFNLLMATAERAAALSSRGDLEAAGRRWEEASGFYRKALRLAPSQFNALISLGVCELQEGRLDEAGRQLGKAVALYPESADAHLEYALDLYFLRRFDEAAAQCREALRLNPTLPGARQGLQKIEAARGT